MKVRTTNPVIIERLTSFSLADLRRHGFFDKSETYKTMPVAIKKRNGFTIETSGIQVSVSRQDTGCGFVQLEYLVDDEHVNYKIPLVQVQNNMGGGFAPHWYLLCPYTKTRCKKLFLNGKYFTHRSGISNGYYMQQILSRSSRSGFERMKKLHSLERIVANGSSKNFKRQYSGMVTQKQLKLMEAYHKIDSMGN